MRISSLSTFVITITLLWSWPWPLTFRCHLHKIADAPIFLFLLFSMVIKNRMRYGHESFPITPVSSVIITAPHQIVDNPSSCAHPGRCWLFAVPALLHRHALADPAKPLNCCRDVKSGAAIGGWGGQYMSRNIPTGGRHASCPQKFTEKSDLMRIPDLCLLVITFTSAPYSFAVKLMQQSRKVITSLWLSFIHVCILYSRSTTMRTTCWLFRSGNFDFRSIK